MTAACRGFLVALGAPALAYAQTVSIAAAIPASLTAALGVNQQVVGLPAGAMTAQGTLVASVSNLGGDAAVTSFSWTAAAAATSMQIVLRTEAVVTGSTPGQAAAGPFEILLAVTMPTPTNVSFELTRTLLGTAGGVMPLTRVDIGDDGQVELTETSPGPTIQTVLVGAAPLPIRCRFDLSLSGIGNTLSALWLTGVPASTQTGSLLQGCDLTSYIVSPRFDGNLDYGLNAFAGPTVAVFGLATQPLFLGVQSPGPWLPAMPCVLMPRPDLAVFLPSLAPQTLVIPPAARPIALYTQAVGIGASTLTTSVAYQVWAY